jgi:S-adenosylmethionine:tRNA ribosyltransferase-isomerase
MPLPPYFRRDVEPEDRDRYQTAYASARGAIAAPTAGLHFTAEVDRALEVRGIEIRGLTLHVGLATFLPVRGETLEEHVLPPEKVTIPHETASAIERGRAARRRIVAVGTTTVRALEGRVVEGSLAPGDGETSLFIRPGHRFDVVGAMLTNFHLPRSTLLVLVCAFAGRRLILDAYAHAVRAGYRFYSYGDAMLVV